jgi:MYXO-CTERM domain-containing protein
MKTTFITLGILVLLCCAAPSFASSVSICDGVTGNLVQNCGFEAGNFSYWTVLNNDGNTAVEGVTFTPPGLNSGNFAAVLGDYATTPTTIEQTFSDISGTTLTFSFYASTDDSGGSLSADYDGSTVATVPNNITSGYAEYSATVTATGSDTISFIEQGPIGGYMGLDDVVVVDPPPSSAVAATPEPSSLAFVAVFALGVLVLTRRRRASAQI